MKLDTDIVKDIIQEVVKDFLIPKFIELGMNASGDWINALEVRMNGENAEIWGMDYTYFLVNGRSSGTKPPIAPLVRWVGYKFGYSGQQATSTAFAIANKIEKEGTNYYPEGTDLLEVLESKEVVDFINSKLVGYIIETARAEIVRITKEVLV